jgi:hypothetical protein
MKLNNLRLFNLLLAFFHQSTSVFMRMVFLFLLLGLSNTFLHAQNINGKYRALEPLDFRMQENGSLHFIHEPERFKHKWFYEVTVTLSGNIIYISKQYTTTDSLGNRLYADSITGVFHYIGTLKKGEGLYYAMTHLNNKPILYPTI